MAQQSYRDYMDEGSDLMLSGNFTKAIEMFDKALETNSKVLPYLWQRGLAYYFAEKYEEGVKQFDVDMTVNGTDVEETVWRFLCIAASRGFDQAKQTISVPTGSDKRVPMLQIYNLFAGKGSIEDVLAEINKDSPLKHKAQFYGYYYIGLYYESMRNIDAAVEHIKKALTYSQGLQDYMVPVAEIQLKKLTKQL